MGIKCIRQSYYLGTFYTAMYFQCARTCLSDKTLRFSLQSNEGFDIQEKTV